MNLARAVRLTKPRLTMVVAAVLAAAAVVTFTSQGASARPDSPSAAQWHGGTKPVIVLVHGAWADASSWDGVIQRLQHDGYTVYAPPNPLRGLAGPSSDSVYLHDFLTENPALAGKRIVLVGHSYGGAVITNAAVGDREVKALVFVDAFIPDQGEAIGGGAPPQPRKSPGLRRRIHPRPRRDHRRAARLHARIMPGRQPHRYLQPRALPRRPARGR